MKFAKKKYNLVTNLSILSVSTMVNYLKESQVDRFEDFHSLLLFYVFSV